MNTDHTSGTSPFDLGTSNVPIDSNSFDGREEHGSSNPSALTSSATINESGSAELEGPETAAIEFRVVRPGVPVRRLRLTGNRYTFGSAEGCSIRLNDPTLRPMHAVLIRDAHRILVRAYSVPLEINGNRITEASLQLGDIVRMGAYRFELLAGLDPTGNPESVSSMQNHAATDYRSQQPNHAQPNHIQPNHPQPNYIQQNYAPVNPAISHNTMGPHPGYSAGAMPDIESAAWQAHLRHESAQWRLRQSEVDVRENRCIERETDLRSREAELWARADQVHVRESKLAAQEAAAIQIHEEFVARKQELKRLRDESRVQQELLDERQTQIQNMEAEYSSQVEQATRQLEQSQSQAESATQAVQRMREQFSELNEQLAVLTDQQKSLENHDHAHLEQQRQLRVDLERARDEAIDARAESEAQRQAAENRVEELTHQLEDTGNVSSELESLTEQLQESETRCQDAEARVNDLTEKLTSFQSNNVDAEQRIEEYESLNQQLRNQIEELQTRVSEATSEASQLRADYEGSCASIRQLELLVDQTTAERDEAQTGLTAESESLRESVNQLTEELDKANEELNELRSANEALSNQLNETRVERDEAVNDAESRPTTEAWDELSTELEDANQRLEQMQREYSETLARIDGSTHQDHTETPNKLPSSKLTDSATMNTMLREEVAEVSTSVADQNPSEEESDESISASTATGAALGAVSMVGSVFAKPAVTESPATDAAPSSDANGDNEASTTTTDDSVEDDDSSGWPTYESALEADSDASESVETTQKLDVWNTPNATEESELNTAELESGEQETGELNVSDEASSLWASEANSSEDDTPEEQSENIWRRESEQSVQQSGHLSAWDTPDSETEASQDAPQWEEESPEVAVSETIADIESNVDQAIADINNLTNDAVAPYSTEVESYAGDSVADEDGDTDQQPSQESVFDTDETPTDPESAYEPINPWSQDISEDQNTLEKAEPSETDYASEADYTSDIEQYQPHNDDHSDSDSLGLVDDDSSDSVGSLADQLINDLAAEADSSTGAVADLGTGTEADSSDVYGYDTDAEVSSYDDDSQTESTDEHEVESTFVMDTDVGLADDAAASTDWNLQTPDSVESDVEYDTSYDDTTEDTSSYGSDESHEVPQDDESSSYGSYNQEPDQEESNSDESVDLVAETPADSGEPDDDSIEAYMNRLLQRVQGDDDASHETVPAATETQAVAQSTAIVDSDAESHPTEEIADEPKHDPSAPLVPRSQAPERNTDMSAMRELANQSARSAVARSVKIKARDTQMEATYKFGAAAVTLICAVGCFWGLSKVPTAQWLGVILALCATGFFIKEGWDKWKEAAARVRLADSAQAGDAEAAKALAEEQQAEAMSAEPAP